MTTKQGSNGRKSKKAVRGGGTVKARLEFIDLGDREAPELRLAVRGPDGKKKELKADAAGAYALPKDLVGKGARLEIRSKTGEDVRSFRYDGFVESVAATGVYEFGEVVWGRWLKVRHCVSGRVRVCRPYQYLTTLASAEFAFANLAADSVAQVYRANLGRVLSDRGILSGAYELTPQFPVRCEPVCHGRVEVFVRTCCCPTLTLADPPYVLVELCKIIDCYPKEIEWIPPEEMVEPGRFPGPRPDPIAKLQMATVRALERAETDEAAPAKERVLWAATHLSELVALPTAEAQMQYIESHADLACICCGCSVRKVAEVPLEPDGSFDACFYLSALVRYGCRRRVQYQVTQFQDEGAVVVYDGLATGERFRLSEFAELDASWKAESCDDTEYDPEAEPFVLLERTGGTWADNLIFTGKAAGIDPQDGTASYGPLAPADGLVNSAEQPWAKTLRLRFQFHPNLAGLGATKYRVRVFRVNNSGNATGYVKTLTNGISWRKYYDKGSGVPGVKWISLNEPGGYYKIPYPDNNWPWLGGQFHATIDTTDLDGNGRYLFVVDIFDAAGHRLIPSIGSLTATPTEHKRNFGFYRLKGPLTDPTQDLIEVDHKALANLFQVNNTACTGLIHGIAHNASTSTADCQFLIGPATDQVRIKYTARHVNGFQYWHWVRVKRGLFGGWQYFDLSADLGNQTTSDADVIAGFTQPKTFGAMLSDDSPAKTKCTFTVQVHVRAKHTNGSRRIHEYDRWPTGSFALEIA